MSRTHLPLAPAVFGGIQPGFGPIAAFELWHLTADIPGSCKNSTVSRRAIEAAGYYLPAAVASAGELPTQFSEPHLGARF